VRAETTRAFLVVAGPEGGRRVDLAAPATTIGAGPGADVVVAGAGSALVAVVLRDEAGWFLQEIGSSVAVGVNGQAVPPLGRRRLAAGDVVRAGAGAATLVFVADGAPATAPATSPAAAPAAAPATSPAAAPAGAAAASAPAARAGPAAPAAPGSPAPPAPRRGSSARRRAASGRLAGGVTPPRRRLAPTLTRLVPARFRRRPDRPWLLGGVAAAVVVAAVGGTVGLLVALAGGPGPGGGDDAPSGVAGGDAAAVRSASLAYLDSLRSARAAETAATTSRAAPAPAPAGAAAVASAAAGPRLAAVVAGPRRAVVRSELLLDGYSSEGPFEELAWRWRIAERPEGSRARLSSATRPWTFLLPDLPGTYVVELAVAAGGRESAPARHAIAVEGSPDGPALADGRAGTLGGRERRGSLPAERELPPGPAALLGRPLSDAEAERLAGLDREAFSAWLLTEEDLYLRWWADEVRALGLAGAPTLDLALPFELAEGRVDAAGLVGRLVAGPAWCARHADREAFVRAVLEDLLGLEPASHPAEADALRRAFEGEEASFLARQVASPTAALEAAVADPRCRARLLARALERVAGTAPTPAELSALAERLEREGPIRLAVERAWEVGRG